MSEKGQSRKSMFAALKNIEELRRLYDSDTPVLAYEKLVEAQAARRQSETAHISAPIASKTEQTPQPQPLEVTAKVQ